MRLLRISVVVLVLLALVADRVGAMVAADVIATRLQAAGSLSTKPHVSIPGFPFLTQALSGRYDRIELSATDLRRRTVALSRFDVTVKGARVPLSEALNGHVAAVPVESLSAQAVIGYGTIGDRTGMQSVTVKRAGFEVFLSGQLRVLGQAETVQALCEVRLDGSTLVLSPSSVHVSAPSPAVVRAVAPMLMHRISIGSLPYGLHLTGLQVAAEGIVLSARSGPTVLERP